MFKAKHKTETRTGKAWGRPPGCPHLTKYNSPMWKPEDQASSATTSGHTM